MTDPGLALGATTMQQALRLLSPALGIAVPAAEDARFESSESIEEVAERTNCRARRVLLDGPWWEAAGMPMLARVTDRRRLERDRESLDAPGGTGWVALIPKAMRGYTLAAIDLATGEVVRWDVDADVAARLAPFAYTLHRLFEPRALATRDVLRFAWSHDRPGVALVIVAAAAAALVGLLTPIASGLLIDRAIPIGSNALIVQLLAGLFTAGLALIALETLRSIALARFEAHTGVAVQGAILDRIIAAPAPFFRRFASGDLALRMAAVNTVQRSIAESAIGLCISAFFIIANLGLLLYYSPSLAAASMGLAVIAVIVPLWAGLARVKLGRRIEALDGKLNALSFELFAGISKLRAAAAEPRAFRNWIAVFDDLRTVNRRSANLSNYEAVTMSLLQPLAAIVLFGLAWWMGVGAKGTPGAALTLGDFVAFQAALFSLLGGVAGVVATGMDLLRLKPLWERAQPILEAAPEAAAIGGRAHDPLGAIALEKVSFAYPDGPDVLHDIDLEVRPGEFVAIVGASGSGKSTLFRLLLGFEKPARGRVLYDGQDFGELDIRRVRRGIGSVLQNGKLWPGDLFTNIAGSSNADVEAVWEAARRAGIAEDIEAMPMGLYTLVGEGLSTLSGGQRQRVLLARALIGDPRILLLDEATSALDNARQAQVLAGLEGLRATRVVIAHRLATVQRADRVVVLDQGRIVQAGPPAELASQPGPFSGMLARQRLG